MNWIELSAEVPAEHVDAVCAVLTDLAPGGCSIEEPVVLLGPEEGFRREPWRPSVVRVYLPVDDTVGERIEELRRDAPVELSWTARQVREEDWATAWKAHFHAERVGRRLVIQPSWEAFEPRHGDVVVKLDPGMAFGTGQHETTRMCLVALEDLLRPGVRVLDLGSGSGILAVAAALLGAAGVDAVDLDPVAVEAATENAQRNGVADRIRVAAGSLDERWPFRTPPRDSYDIVLANIHAAAVGSLAPAIAAALRRGGALVGSGIIAERLPEVLDALAATGFEEPEVRGAGDWRAVIARRRQPAGP